jgi:hypothetical protein
MNRKIMGLQATGLMWLVVALIANGTSLGIAHAQSVIALNPSAFAPGTNVSNAFAGVTLSSMSFVSAGTDPVTGIPLWTPTYAPVYAEGSLFAQNILTGPNSGMQTGLWGTVVQPVSGDCFQVCNQSNFQQDFDMADDPVTNLLVSFNSPVSFASALQMGNFANGEFLDAFNSSDQLVAQCIPSFGTPPIGNYGCFSVLNTQYQSSAYLLETSVTAPDISKILLGGYNQGAQIGAIEAVRAPEIDPTSAASGLTLLLGGLLVLRGRRTARL